MFKVQTIEKCPVTEESVGIITMSPEQIGMVAGAVRDNIEWAVLLHGTRSEDGFEIKVEKVTVPLQSRSSTEVKVEELDLPDDVVGVMHSHHRMGAFFSKTDTDDLNPRFPSSIVVAVANNTFGFNYKAVGKVVLPCGSVGLIDFAISVDGVEEYEYIPRRAEHKGEVKDLFDCPNYQLTQITTYKQTQQSTCGLTTPEKERAMVFGTAGGNELLQVIREQTKSYTYWGQSNQQSNNGHKKGKKSKKDKKGRKRTVWSARKGGNQRLETRDRTTLEDSATGCDSCDEKSPKLYWYPEFAAWLCSECGAVGDEILNAGPPVAVAEVIDVEEIEDIDDETLAASLESEDNGKIISSDGGLIIKVEDDPWDDDWYGRPMYSGYY